jgi:hypothetical protein
LVHPDILKAIGESNSWLRLDEGCLMDLDIIRRGWGAPIYINIGKADSRGLRPPNDPDGAFYSVHKMGKAFDLVTKDNKGLWEFIELLIIDGVLRSFNTLESRKHTPTWTHVAKMNTDECPLIINP